LGYLDHLARIQCLKVNNPISGSTHLKEKYFNEDNIDEFNDLLQDELWEDVFLSDDDDISLMLLF
jgi:hypothetical protein